MAVKKTAKRKPPNAGKGRKKGSKNVVKKGIRDALEGALNTAPGGEQGFFEKMREEQPVAFLQVVSKLLPIQIEQDIKANVNSKVTIEIVGLDGPVEK